MGTVGATVVCVPCRFHDGKAGARDHGDDTHHQKKNRTHAICIPQGGHREYFRCLVAAFKLEVTEGRKNETSRARQVREDPT